MAVLNGRPLRPHEEVAVPLEAVEQLAGLEAEVEDEVGALVEQPASLLADGHAADVLELLQGVAVIDAAAVGQNLAGKLSANKSNESFLVI